MLATVRGVSTRDPFAGAIEDAGELINLYPAPEARSWRKDVGRIDAMAARLIAVAPVVLVASSAADGRADVSPRGGPPGFVTVLDEQHLVIPDATGNRRLDTLRNVVATGEVGLLFLIPGRDTTLRVNGAACVTTASEVLERIPPVGRDPVTAIVVRVRELYTHCPKALIRSALWDPATWPAVDSLPTSAQVTLAHASEPELTLEEVERRQEESLRLRLA
jgi:PPOX class probable FMN-dependent enzyme